ncbi:leucyl aminopeptidase [Pasteurellaceae bacterium HPA106]|uniref:leucyl aminopeptidase n=1 Tax=Spirabiliibacterium pneumoniae TaxID=221400 RepID=UPI001AAC72CD|nr:leucyl aminopeptidase [Spirabiliibacterium pneumoniae]MBE2896586.1 leucyl aminopeptidase [Spirabiliibacterium pneumoniae]
MQYALMNGEITALPSDCLVLGVYQHGDLDECTQRIDDALQGKLSALIEKGDFAAKCGQTVMLYDITGIAAQRVLLVGAGKKDKLDVRQYQKMWAAVFTALKDSGVETALCCLHQLSVRDRNTYWKVRFAVEQLARSSYVFDRFKKEKANAPALRKVQFWCELTEPTLETAIVEAQAIAYGVKATKDIANLPANIANPAYLAECARELAQECDVVIATVIDEAEMAKLGMNAYLAVSRGSHNPAFMSLIDYNNTGNPDAQPIVLVGKGLTFDAGGISLKPSADMDEMKYDMGGAAAVYGVMKALTKLQLPVRVIGVLAGCENMPDGNAYRPGDILTTMKGLSVEVLNTDAEGRLVLCDALTYVERLNPEVVIDIATLTGACVVALGQHNSGLLSPNESLATALLDAAAQAGDKAWRLPLGEEYSEQLKSNFADLANIGGRWGGASTAGAFLSHFTENYTWAHLDIAGTAWKSGAEKGATGRPVALLVQYLLDQVNKKGTKYNLSALYSR